MALTWSPVASLPAGRAYFGQSVLPDSNVLITGDITVPGNAHKYDFVTNKWTTQPLRNANNQSLGIKEHLQISLASGKVLLINGMDLTNNYIGEILEYNFATGTSTAKNVSPGGSAGAVRGCLLQDGRVLVITAGQISGAKAAIYLYTPSTDTWQYVRDFGSNPDPNGIGVSLLLDGRVLITGGSGSGRPSALCYIFDPAILSTTRVADMPRGLRNHGQSTLPDGRVLITGGQIRVGSNDVPTAEAYVYDKDQNTWTRYIDLPSPRVSHGQSTLPNGAVFVAGGRIFDTSSSTNLSDAYVLPWNYDPVLTLTNPSNNQIVSEVTSKRTIAISGTVSDANNDTVTVRATINGKLKSTSVTAASTTKSWSLTWDVVSDAIPQGAYSNIVVTADDGNGGASSATYTGTITVDKTAPVITISGVTEGTTYQNTVTPTFSATDSGGSGLDKVTATLNGVAYTSGTAITASGAKTLIVTAVDKAGNQSQKTVNFSINKLPTLTLTSPPNNQTLTENSTMSVQGSATDVDSGNVVTVKYKINNGPTRALQSGVSNGSTPISFAKNLTFKGKRMWDGAVDVVGVDLAENVNHTLEVWAEDDQGGKSTVVTRTFKVIWNRPPVISDSNRDLGILETPPTVNYSVTDPEGNPFTVTEKIDGVVVRSFAGVTGRQETFQISPDAWLKLEPSVLHTLTIEATDDQGAKSTRIYTLTRLENQLSFEIETPWTTDVAAQRVLLTMDMSLPPGAVFVAEACNNAFDATPTWEDISFNARYGRGYVFQNNQKTASAWGVSIRVHIEKGTATDPITVKGFGGAFD
ncbi:Ig-like domain-containing protein [Paenibacillus chitinolyticus]